MVLDVVTRFLIQKGTALVANRLHDFRAISISPVISKVFELGVIDRFKNLLSSSDNQFGFKKNVSCNHAIYSLRKVVDSYTPSGFTVNICF